MASSAATSFLLPQAVSFLRWPSKHKTLPPPSPPPLRWNPLFVWSTPLAAKSLFFSVPTHGKLARVVAQSSFLGAVDAAEEEIEVVRLPRSVLDGGGLLCTVLEDRGPPKGSALLAAVFWGAFVTTIIPCAALLAASSSFFYVRQPTSSSWSYSGCCSTHHGFTRLGPAIEESVLSLMLGSVAALKLLTGFLSDSYDGWTPPKLQVSMSRSHSRSLHQIVKNSESPFLGELSSMCTDFYVRKANFRNTTEVACQRGRNMSIKWNNWTWFPRKLHFQGLSPNNRQIHVVKAVATSTPHCLVHTDCDAKLLLVSDLDVQEVNFKTINDETSEVDDRERLRRLRISKANKGNVPWNKGRKHSAETVQRIRERTKLAMQNPKVKMKLVNLGHAQSEETRIKIAAGVREGWRRRQRKRLVQEGCFFEWQNLIAESARKGWPGEEELQWDSYKTLDRQLKQQWLESIEKRKNMPRIKGSKRAPKSPEQRRKISEAISAKWADEEYRARVCSGLAKFHGIAVGVERRPRKPTGESPERKTTRRRTVKSERMSHDDTSNKKVVPKRKSSSPSYKDPMTSQKLEILKKIRDQRAVKEAKDAMERAKLLIAEAEKAARALEIAALTSPLAQASLLETRKLISEAKRSIETIETGRSTIQDLTDKRSLDTSEPLNHFQSSNAGEPTTEKFNERLVNGFHLLSSSQTNDENLSSGKLPSLAIVNGMEPEKETQTEKSAEFGSFLHTKIVEDESEKVDHRVSRPFANSFIQYEDNSAKEDTGKAEVKSSSPSKTFSVKSKKWVRGRLIEIDENDTWEKDSMVGKRR